MYALTDKVIELFKNNEPQIARITVNPVVGEAFTITEADILTNGFQLNRSSVSGSTIELGSVIASELTLNLDNYEGKFQNVQFEGAQLYVYIGVEKEESTADNPLYHIVPFGYFTVDEITKSQSSVFIAALDDMMKFDKAVNPDFGFNLSVGDMIISICAKCGITLASSLTSLPNNDYIISAKPEINNLTYRQLLAWCCQIMGVCAFMDYDGKLALKWYTQTETHITPSDRYSSTLDENAITVSGIYFSNDEQAFLSGTDEYAIDLTGNALISHDEQSVIDNIYNSIGGFTYTPFTAQLDSMPHLEPLDIIDFIDADNKAHPTIITDWTYSLNRNTVIAGQGTSSVKKAYASSNPFTAAQANIIERNRKNQEKALTENEQSMLNFNKTIANSLGLYRTKKAEINGSTKFYYHNAETLETSTYAFTMTAEGFAFASRESVQDGDGWPDSFWQYGIGKDGNAILNFLRVNKLSADLIEAGVLKSINTYDGESVMQFDLNNGTIRSVGEKEVITGVDDDGNVIYETVKGSVNFSSGGIGFRSDNIAVNLSANGINLIEYIKLIGSLEIPYPRWIFAKDKALIPKLYISSRFSSSDITFAEGVDQAASPFDTSTVQIRNIGYKVQLRGKVTFTMGSGTTDILSFPTDKYPVPDRSNVYKLVPCTGGYIAKIFVRPNGSIACDRISSLGSNTPVTGNITWLQLDMEWDTE